MTPPLLAWIVSVARPKHFCATVIHKPACTYLHENTPVPKSPKGTIYWEQLNYEWCQKFCVKVRK